MSRFAPLRAGETMADTHLGEAIVRVEGAVKEYPFGPGIIRALDGVTLAVPRGRMTALLGPSGSGKTVLLNLISGLEQPDRGRVLVEGRDLGRMTTRQLTANRRSTIGFVFQGFNLIPNLSALENIMLPLEFAGVSERESLRQAREMLAAVGLAARASHTPPQLSGGEQQRVAIARALANDPPILLADDPIGNVDSQLGGEIVGILRQMADRGKTVVVAGHHAAIEEAADEVVYFRDGRIERVWNARAAQRVSESGRGGNRP